MSTLQIDYRSHTAKLNKNSMIAKLDRIYHRLQHPKLLSFKVGPLIKLPNPKFPHHVYYIATFLYQFLSSLVKSNDVCISPGVPSERDGRLQHGVWEGRGLRGPGIIKT